LMFVIQINAVDLEGSAISDIINELFVSKSKPIDIIVIGKS
jgi:hypothetical protein